MEKGKIIISWNPLLENIFFFALAYNVEHSFLTLYIERKIVKFFSVNEFCSRFCYCATYPRWKHLKSNLVFFSRIILYQRSRTQPGGRLNQVEEMRGRKISNVLAGAKELGEFKVSFKGRFSRWWMMSLELGWGL